MKPSSYGTKARELDTSSLASFDHEQMAGEPEGQTVNRRGIFEFEV